MFNYVFIYFPDLLYIKGKVVWEVFGIPFI